MEQDGLELVVRQTPQPVLVDHQRLAVCRRSGDVLVVNLPVGVEEKRAEERGFAQEFDPVPGNPVFDGEIGRHFVVREDMKKEGGCPPPMNHLMSCWNF